MGYHPQNKRMQVLSLHPEVTREQVQANTSFPLEFVDKLESTPCPTERELELLRTEVDPHRYIKGRAI